MLFIYFTNVGASPYQDPAVIRRWLGEKLAVDRIQDAPQSPEKF